MFLPDTHPSPSTGFEIGHRSLTGDRSHWVVRPLSPAPDPGKAFAIIRWSDGPLRERNFFRRHPAASQALTHALLPLEKRTGLCFGCPDRPLLLSATLTRCGNVKLADLTVSPLGLTDQTIPGLLQSGVPPVLIYRSYAELIATYADIVMERTHHLARQHASGIRLQMARRRAMLAERKGNGPHQELAASDEAFLAGTYKAMFQAAFREAFPDNPREQLEGMLTALFTLESHGECREIRLEPAHLSERIS